MRVAAVAWMPAIAALRPVNPVVAARLHLAPRASRLLAQRWNAPFQSAVGTLRLLLLLEASIRQRVQPPA